MSHAIPIEIRGENPTRAVNAPVAPTTQLVPLNSLPVMHPAKPPFARSAGAEWSIKELQLVEQSFRTAGHAAAYQAIPHRSKAAVRGRLQRAGLVPKRAAKLTH